jgi:hypothetical protein
MNVHATLVTESKDAASQARALNVDNVSMGSLNAITRAEGKLVITELHAKSIGTLMATVDDILRCQITSESLMQDGQ